MKRIKAVLILILLAGCLSGCAGKSWREFNADIDNTPVSHASHIVGGGIVSGLTYHYLPEDMNPAAKVLLSVGAAFAAGAVSEATDKNWNNQDLVEWGIGGAASLIVFKWEW